MVTLEALALLAALSGAGDTVLLDFTASWCGPCQTMEPTVGRLVREGYPVHKIDVDQQPQLAARFQVTGVPCFVMLADGQEVDRISGACSHARLLEMFAAARVRATKATAPPATSSTETVRGQSPDSQLVAVPPIDAPPASTPISHNAPRPTTHEHVPQGEIDPRKLAYQATVRLRIEDANGHSIGTGTIVDLHGSEALAVTCAHIFRDSQGKGRVLVDLFAEGQSRTVEGTVISYDLDRDIGLISFLPGTQVAPARIAPAGYRFRAGDPVFSVGADHGRDPSVRESRITAIDRYLGPPNIEAAGEPAPGRSGGGLFSQDGFLIGVCNHGDPADDEGIYASLPTIHWELDRVGQRRIYQPNAEALALASHPRRVPAPAPGVAASPATVIPVTAHADTMIPVAAHADTVIPVTAHADTMSPLPSQGFGADTEVICIVRSRGKASSEERVYVLDQPAPDLLDRLARESRRGLAAQHVATNQPLEERVPATGTRAPGLRPLMPGEPVVRAQSSDGR